MTGLKQELLTLGSGDLDLDRDLQKVQKQLNLKSTSLLPILIQEPDASSTSYK